MENGKAFYWYWGSNKGRIEMSMCVYVCLQYEKAHEEAYKIHK